MGNIFSDDLRGPDFNGDGRADVPWRSQNTGENGFWLMNGTGYLGFAVLPRVGASSFSDPSTPLDWEFINADFNGDNRSDYFWRNTSSGANGLWLINGSSVASFVNLPAMSPSWGAAIADFNGDQKADLLWQNFDTGQNQIWLMNGGAVTPIALPSVGNGNDWKPSIGDFNGDGKTDLLWNKASAGVSQIWIMDGGTIFATAPIPTVPTGAGNNWRFALADFNGDLKTDLLWRNFSTGANGIWLMNNANVTTFASLPTLPVSTSTDWELNLGDFNGDGKADLFWRDYVSGQNGIWLMDGTRVATFASQPSLPTLFSSGNTSDWFSNVADLNGDGRSDLIWRDQVTGNNSVWLMNGSSIIAGASLLTVAPSWFFIV